MPAICGNKTSTSLIQKISIGILNLSLFLHPKYGSAFLTVSIHSCGMPSKPKYAPRRAAAIHPFVSVSPPLVMTFSKPDEKLSA